MEICLVDENDTISTMEDGFWGDLAGHLQQCSDEDRRTLYRSNVLYGEYRHDPASSIGYTYLGKSRPQVDWPDIQNALGAIGSLTSVPDVRGLLEPVYIAPVNGTNRAAFLRTSGGPTWSAIDVWLNDVTGREKDEPQLHLRPVLREGALERLQSALGVSKLHVKLDPGALGNAPAGGVISSAAQEVEAISGDLSMELILSFGHATPDNLAAEDLKHQLEHFMREFSFRKSSATLMVDRGTEGVKREKVDFLNDKITSFEDVDMAEDNEPSAQAAARALASAIEKYNRGTL